MLGLLSNTNPDWVKLVDENLSIFISDHLYAEQKAASNGFSFVIQYPERTELIKKMGAYALEESEHFNWILDYMLKNEIELQKDQKSEYVYHLRRFFPKTKDRDDNFVNRLLLASLIEARSCERFTVFSKYTKHKELTTFYHDLIKDEVGHYKLFLNLAKVYQEKDMVTDKWQRLLIYEANYIEKMGKTALVHG